MTPRTRYALRLAAILAFFCGGTAYARAETAIVGPNATVDAGLAIPASTPVRITASGAIGLELPPAGCLSSVGPRGCPVEGGAGPRPAPVAPYGSLVAFFVDTAGRSISPVFFIGEAALAISPPQASRLRLAINAQFVAAQAGTFVVSASLAIPASARNGVGVTSAVQPGERPPLLAQARRALTQRWINQPARRVNLTGRQIAQHLARRFAFGLAPEEIDAVAAGGTAAWLRRQLTPGSIDDSVISAFLQPKPTTTLQDGTIADFDVYERRLIQREFITSRQLQEKLVLHWLEHFSVGIGKVADPALMSHYEETLRADALGNFKQLVSDVSKEPAMLIWLDNNGNDGSNPQTNPPNENFSRELMQLHVTGTAKLNPDGTPLSVGGLTQPVYTQADVRAVAQALTGFSLLIDYTGGKDPNTRFSVVYDPLAHTPGPKTILGQTVTEPNTPQCVDTVINVLVHDPSTAPFQAKELLQRFVTETPSPQYVAAIAAVFAQTVDAPDQIAQVINAIVNHPDFAAAYHQQLKEPLEIMLDALRLVPGSLKSANVGGTVYGPGFDLAGNGGILSTQRQEPYAPPSVFSFYRPGNKAALLSQQTFLFRINGLTGILSADAFDPTVNTALDTSRLNARIGSSDPGKIADYLLDALLDGVYPALRSALLTYLQNGVDVQHLRGAVWLVETAPEYEIN